MKNNDIRLDVGCGGRGTMYKGFIGIDIHPTPSNPRTPGAVYKRMDFINDKLPWKPNTIEEIVCFHVIEHMKREEGVVLINRIHSLLKRGCKAYISCPDTELFIDKYVKRDYKFFLQVYPKTGKEMWPGRTMLDRLFFSMHDDNPHGHRTPYDLETLFNAAEQAGCTKMEWLRPSHEWSRRPDHETGIIITKE